ICIFIVCCDKRKRGKRRTRNQSNWFCTTYLCLLRFCCSILHKQKIDIAPIQQARQRILPANSSQARLNGLPVFKVNFPFLKPSCLVMFHTEYTALSACANDRNHIA